MAWELGNELNGMTPSWIHTIAAFVHRLAPRQLIMAGQQYGINPATLTDPLVSVVDAHFYPAILAFMKEDASMATAAGKVFVAGEYASVSATPQLFAGIEADREISGAAFWSLFAHLNTYGYEQHNDGETVHFPGISSAMRQRDHLIRAFDYAMSGYRSTPPEPPPGQPILTLYHRLASATGAGAASAGITGAGTASAAATKPQLTARAGPVILAWRGTTDAATYSVEQSTAGPRGPWSTVCRKCANDDTTPWTCSSAPGTEVWYRVIPYNENGIVGTPSPAVKVQAIAAPS